ncbi:hypothetical protein I6E29_06650 [Arcanobacterium haemolyticum]|nr:hypothetical protein [Arcanobacterium haemolyticum]
MTETRWELLYGNDGLVGLVFRRWNDDELLTDEIYGGRDPHRITTTIELIGKRWKRSTCVENDDTPIVLNAEELIEEEDAIPEPLEFFLLRSAIETLPHDSDATLTYHVLSPNDRHGIATEASIWSPSEGCWEIEEAGELRSTHWVKDGEITRSVRGSIVAIPHLPEAAAASLRGVIADEIIDEHLANSLD